MIDLRVIKILACPDCWKEIHQKNTGYLSCSGCRRDFEIFPDNIISMQPTKKKKLPEMYFDPVYIEAMKHVEKIFSCIYDSNSLIARINNSYHKIQESLLLQYSLPDQMVIDLCCGVGTHLKYVPQEKQILRIGLDSNLELLRICRKQFAESILIWGDIYSTPFKSESLSHVLCLSSLEHIYFLKDALVELERILLKDGLLFVTIPAEGGLMWNTGRSLTTQRMFENMGVNYKKYIEVEHCNTAEIILESMKAIFETKVQKYYPFKFPSLNLNLLINGIYVKKNK